MRLFPLWEILGIVKRTEKKVDQLDPAAHGRIEKKIDALQQQVAELDRFVREQFVAPMAERAGEPEFSGSTVDE